MIFRKSIPAKTALAAVMAAGALVAAASPAAADVACNRYGECWHVRDHYDRYPHELGVRFYGDDWASRHHRHYHWRRDRDDDHGYYSHGVWRPF